MLMDDNYVAGLFDGEGFARIFKKVRQGHVGYYPAVGIGMTHYPVIKMLYDEFGGHLNENRHDLRNPKYRIQFCWGIHNQGVAPFLRRILPYVIVKREEVELVLALRDHIDQNPYHHKGRDVGNNRKDIRDEILAYREDLYMKCKILKKRAYPTLTD
jgi:hypothetical protein